MKKIKRKTRKKEAEFLGFEARERSHAEICPVCGGKGKIQDRDQLTTGGYLEKTCHGCLGCGWVRV